MWNRVFGIVQLRERKRKDNTNIPLKWTSVLWNKLNFKFQFIPHPDPIVAIQPEGYHLSLDLNPSVIEVMVLAVNSWLYFFFSFDLIN